MQWFPTFLAPGTYFMGDNFSMDPGRGMVWGWFRSITFIVHFIPIIIPAPPQTTGTKSRRLEAPGLMDTSFFLHAPGGGMQSSAQQKQVCSGGTFPNRCSWERHSSDLPFARYSPSPRLLPQSHYTISLWKKKFSFGKWIIAIYGHLACFLPPVSHSWTLILDPLWEPWSIHPSSLGNPRAV